MTRNPMLVVALIAVGIVLVIAALATLPLWMLIYIVVPALLAAGLAIAIRRGA